MTIASQLAGFGTGFLYWFIAPVLVITVVVFIHELGHFLVARWCGVKISAFSIGFGPEIFGFHDRHGTRWRFAWIPLGGYVKFIDDENAASVPDHKKLAQMSPEDRAGSFQGKPLWQRAAVVAAGPFANFLLTLVLFALLFGINGEKLRVARIDAVVPGSAAERAGLKPGDIVQQINGEEVAGFEQLMTTIRTSANEPLDMVVRRGGSTVTLTVTPERKEIASPLGGTIPSGVIGIKVLRKPYIEEVIAGGAADRAGLKPGDMILQIDGKPVPSFEELVSLLRPSAGKTLQVMVARKEQKLTLAVTPRARIRKTEDGKTVTTGIIGVRISAPPEDFIRKHYGPLAAMWKGFTETYKFLETTLVNLKKIADGRESARQLGGPITIVQVSGQVAALGLEKLVWWTAVISASIGLLNLFPIPLLDGGHLMYYAVEAIRGRPLSQKAQEIGFTIGALMVFSLMVLVFYNDLARLTAHWFG